MRLSVTTSKREELVDITGRVAEMLSGHRSGAVLVFSMHTTAGITINENADPDVEVDIVEGLRRVAPPSVQYRHREGNSDAHIKATLTGASVVVPVEDGRLVLGVWQGIYLCEFDGPRTRTVHVSVLAGAI